ncbi:hypothetical protein T492DRAFT_842826 [Pavlovales sp. CCMP2436]|nr:hypothetical protein T492DRAFT_842826 [Pavlovales sp. CCMP2436]
MAPQDFGSVGKILRKDLPAFLRASYASLFTAGMEMGIFGPRHQRSKILMEKVQAKYGAAHVIGDPISALSHGGLREEVVPARNPASAPHLLPGPIRAPLGMIIRGLYAHDYRHI